VGDGDGCISFEKHERHWLAENVASADYERSLASDVDVVVVKDFSDAEWGGASEAGKACGESAKRCGGDAVYILFRSESEKGGVFVQMLRKRVLKQDSVDKRIFVDGFNLSHELFL